MWAERYLCEHEQVEYVIWGKPEHIVVCARCGGKLRRIEEVRDGTGRT